MDSLQHYVHYATAGSADGGHFFSPIGQHMVRSFGPARGARVLDHFRTGAGPLPRWNCTCRFRYRSSLTNRCTA